MIGTSSRSSRQVSWIAWSWGTPAAVSEPRAAAATGTDPDLDRVGAALGEVARALGRADVAAHQLGVREPRRNPSIAWPTISGVTVRDVDHEQVRAGLEQRGRALEEVPARADRGTDHEPSLLVLGRLGPATLEHEIALRDETADAAIGVDQRKLLDPLLVEDACRLLDVDARCSGVKALDRGHERLDGAVLVAVVPGHVAVRQQAGEDAAAARFLDQDPGDPVPAREGPRLAERGVARQRERALDHVAVAALDPLDLARLGVDRHRPVDDPEPAGERHRLAHGGGGDAVHVGRDHRQLERDPPRQRRGEAHLAARVDAAEARADEEIVEGPAAEEAARAHGGEDSGASRLSP